MYVCPVHSSIHLETTCIYMHLRECLFYERKVKFHLTTEWHLIYIAISVQTEDWKLVIRPCCVKLLCYLICLCACRYSWKPGDHFRLPWKLELQAVLSGLTWLLELTQAWWWRCSSSFNQWAVSPAPSPTFFFFWDKISACLNVIIVIFLNWLFFFFEIGYQRIAVATLELAV